MPDVITQPATQRHTKGPWHLSRDGMTIFAGTNGAGVLIRGLEQVIPHVAYIPKNGFAATTAEQRANADLIAAAPELLEWLNRLAGACSYANVLSGPLGKDVLNAAYAAIAKAEGHTP